MSDENARNLESKETPPSTTEEAQKPISHHALSFSLAKVSFGMMRKVILIAGTIVCYLILQFILRETPSLFSLPLVSIPISLLLSWQVSDVFIGYKAGKLREEYTWSEMQEKWLEEGAKIRIRDINWARKKGHRYPGDSSEN